MLQGQGKKLEQIPNDLGLTAKHIFNYCASESSSCLHQPNRHFLNNFPQHGEGSCHQKFCLNFYY